MPKLNKLEDTDLADEVTNLLGGDEDDDLDDDDEDQDDDDVEPADDEDDDQEDDSDSEDDPDAAGRREEDSEFNLNTKSDKKGNLIDPKTGKIIAQAGAPRRFYEKVVKQSQQIQSQDTELRRREVLMVKAGKALTTLQNMVKENDVRQEQIKQLGLSPDEQMEMLSVAAKFKNPATALDALKYMLTKAVQRGIDIKPLGANPGAATDMSVFMEDFKKSMMETMKPISDRFSQSDQRNQARDQFLEERSEFYLNNQVPEKLVPVLDRMVQQPQFQHLGYVGSWYALQNYLLRQQQRGSPGSQNRSRPSGQARPGVQPSNHQIDDAPVSADTDFGDLVKGVLKDYPLDAA